MPQRSVWRNTAAVLGLDTLSALSALGLGSDAEGAILTRGARLGSEAGGADGPGTRFSRLAYRVTVGGVEYTASGLLSEAIMGGDSHDGNASGRLGGRRGVFIWLHGSESLRAAALSRTVTAGADGLVTNSDGTTTLLALLAQLGYDVIAPDDLGLGVSSARHQVRRAMPAPSTVHMAPPRPTHPASGAHCPPARRTWTRGLYLPWPYLPRQTYMNHRALSTVVIELLRGVLRARSGQWAYRAGRSPEVWLMGGSHGGYVVAAVQRRLQEEASLARLWRVSGAFMHAAPLDVSGAMLGHFLANQPLPHAWYLMAIGQSYQAYAPGSVPDFESHLLPDYLDVYNQMEGSASIAELDALLSDLGRPDDGRGRESGQEMHFSRPLDGLTVGYRARLQAART